MSGGGAEATYRRLLRAYPRSWRVHRQEEVVDVLMQGAEQSRDGRVGVLEAAGLLAGGLEERLERVLQLVPLRVRERVAALAIASGAALAVVLLLFAELPLPGRTQMAPYPVTGWGPVMTLGVLPCLGWVLALVLVGVHRLREARWAALITMVVTAAVVPLAQASGLPRPPLFLLGVQVVLAALAGTARVSWSPAARRGVVTTALVLTVVLSATQLARPSLAQDPRLSFYRGWGLPQVGTAGAVLAVVAVVVAIALAWQGRRWLVPAVTVAMPWIYLGLFSTAVTAPDALTGAAVVTSAVLAAGAAAALGRRTATSRPPQSNSTEPLRR